MTRCSASKTQIDSYQKWGNSELELNKKFIATKNSVHSSLCGKNVLYLFLRIALACIESGNPKLTCAETKIGTEPDVFSKCFFFSLSLYSQITLECSTICKNIVFSFI